MKKTRLPSETFNKTIIRSNYYTHRQDDRTQVSPRFLPRCLEIYFLCLISNPSQQISYPDEVFVQNPLIDSEKEEPEACSLELPNIFAIDVNELTHRDETKPC
ncbi:hypothetical protein BHE74_00006376 [Ensete ventricosum]|nr:hypothetical protein BHE74_00006376 [Ensete ventricosum]